MNDVALFALGLVVTLIVAAAVALLVMGAVIDGRENDRWRAGREPAARPEPRGEVAGRPLVTPGRRRIPGSTGA